MALKPYAISREVITMHCSHTCHVGGSALSYHTCGAPPFFSQTLIFSNKGSVVVATTREVGSVGRHGLTHGCADRCGEWHCTRASDRALLNQKSAMCGRRDRRGGKRRRREEIIRRRLHRFVFQQPHSDVKRRRQKKITMTRRSARDARADREIGTDENRAGEEKERKENNFL
jgi:hypothetical protein